MKEIQDKNKKLLIHNVKIRTLKLINVILMTIVFFSIWFIYYSQKLWGKPFEGKGYIAIFCLFIIVYSVFGRIYDAFLISLHRIWEIVYSQTLSLFFSDAVMYAISCLLIRKVANAFPMIICIIIQFVLSILWATYAHRWYFRDFSGYKTLIVYDTREGMENLISEYGMDSKFNIKGILSVDECINDLKILDKDVEVLYMCGIHSHERNIILKECMYRGISVYVIPRIGDVIMSGAKKMHMYHLPMLRVDRYNPNPEYLFLKRTFDVLVSGLAIVVLSPIMLVTALAIKSDGGPAFYKQKRLTKDGKEFYVLKFRSMRVDAEKDGVARLSTGDNDDRITRVGRVIRKIRFDELPQLFNILKGEMTIVGPRPERPEIAKDYEKEMPEFRLRLQAKAGLTGYAQVYGKYNTTPYDKLQMDLMYIANPSFIEDLKICFATVKILFMPESTEGIKEGQTTAMNCRKESDDAKIAAEMVVKTEQAETKLGCSDATGIMYSFDSLRQEERRAIY